MKAFLDGEQLASAAASALPGPVQGEGAERETLALLSGRPGGIIAVWRERVPADPKQCRSLPPRGACLAFLPLRERYK